MGKLRPREDETTARVTGRAGARHLLPVSRPWPGLQTRPHQLPSPCEVPLCGYVPSLRRDLLHPAGFCSEVGDAGAQLPLDQSSDTRPAVCCTLTTACPSSYFCLTGGGGTGKESIKRLSLRGSFLAGQGVGRQEPRASQHRDGETLVVLGLGA